jgi:hypothetical protein
MASSSIDIFDLSDLPRSGFKGGGTLAAMQARGLKLEDQPNRAFRQDDDVLCLVLAATEVFLLASLGGDKLANRGGGTHLLHASAPYPRLVRPGGHPRS